MKLPLSPGSGERQPNVPEISELPRPSAAGGG